MARTTKTNEAATAVETTEVKSAKTTKKKAEETSADRIAYFVKVKITFTTPLLATNPSNEQVYSDYIANEVDPETAAEEVALLTREEVDEKGMTIFLRDKDDPSIPLLKGYTWLGYLKSRSKALAKVPGSALKEAKAYIKEINDLISVYPRFQPLILPDGEAIGTNERPLRAETAQGDRVALAKSEEAPIGTTVEVTFRAERFEGMKLIMDCLDYGEVHGTGQWRNSGFGLFTYEILDKWCEKVETKKFAASDFPMR